MSQDYHEDVKKKNILKLREYQSELPKFVTEFFRGTADTTASRTRLGYALDFRLFFNFLVRNSQSLKGKNIIDLTIEDLGTIETEDIEDFAEYLSYYTKVVDGKTVEIQNEERGKTRKLAAVRSLFSYFYKKRKIESNPAERVDLPKLHNKIIVRLEVEETAMLLDEVESGEHLTIRQKSAHSNLKERDLAIMTLLLGTGMRVSECVGININHLDFNANGVKITRKGGNEVILYFGEEVRAALFEYLKIREKLEIKEGHEEALFISQHKKRITDRSIQILVKKYSKAVINLKKITPHKLRATYGTNLYRESGDIYLVADVLGHSDVNTTKKHYAALDEEKRKSAVKYIQLRKD